MTCRLKSCLAIPTHPGASGYAIAPGHAPGSYSLLAAQEPGLTNSCYSGFTHSMIGIPNTISTSPPPRPGFPRQVHRFTHRAPNPHRSTDPPALLPRQRTFRVKSSIVATQSTTNSCTPKSFLFSGPFPPASPLARVWERTAVRNAGAADTGCEEVPSACGDNPASCITFRLLATKKMVTAGWGVPVCRDEPPADLAIRGWGDLSIRRNPPPNLTRPERRGAGAYSKIC